MMTGYEVLFVLVLVAMVFGLSLVLNSEFGRRWRTGKTLLERNRELIISYIGKVRPEGGLYYIDNLTRDCIAEIARRERRHRLVPATGEWLSNWETRPDIPSEWLSLKERIKAALTRKYEVVAAEHSRQVSAAEEEAQAQCRRLLYDNNRDLIGKFFEIAERKVSVFDEYGEENWDALPQEIETCLTKIAKRSGIDNKTIREAFKKGFFWRLPDEYGWLRDKLDETFREFHRRQKGRPASSFDVNGLSGVEFESWIGRLLIERGFNVSGTPVTGDQGADLIAKRNGKTIIVQAKRYQGVVGNKAVQEVISAVVYYGGDEGWVVTNSSFTPSARALAQKSNVRLVDGRTLERGLPD